MTINAKLKETIEKKISGKIGEKIGSGGLGTIYKFKYKKSKKPFAIKIYNIDKSMKKEVKNGKLNNIKELIKKTNIKIGKLKNIRQFGLKVHNHNISNSQGWYIMNNIMYKYYNKNYITMKLSFYLKKYFSDKEIPKNHKIVNLFLKKLKLFYKITQGFHGDLHFDNINVILKKNSDRSSDVIDIIIYDYTTHTPFLSKTKKISLKNTFQLINDKYSKMKNSDVKRFGLKLKTLQDFMYIMSNKEFIMSNHNENYIRKFKKRLREKIKI